jgi:hypothetical protein
MESHDEQKNTLGSTTLGSVDGEERNPEESSKPTEPIDEEESGSQQGPEPTESIDGEDSGSQFTTTDSTEEDGYGILPGLRHAILHRQKSFAASGYIYDDEVDVSKLALYFTKDDGEDEKPA